MEEEAEVVEVVEVNILVEEEVVVIEWRRRSRVTFVVELDIRNKTAFTSRTPAKKLKRKSKQIELLGKEEREEEWLFGVALNGKLAMLRKRNQSLVSD